MTSRFAAMCCNHKILTSLMYCLTSEAVESIADVQIVSHLVAVEYNQLYVSLFVCLFYIAIPLQPNGVIQEYSIRRRLAASCCKVPGTTIDCTLNER